jgi:Delta14-sterol reductase
VYRTQNPLTGNVTVDVQQTDEVRGWGVIFTYFYIVYFGVLLVHRELRDEAKCARKYGADWERYTAIVKSRIIPGVY